MLCPMHGEDCCGCNPKCCYRGVTETVSTLGLIVVSGLSNSTNECCSVFNQSVVIDGAIECDPTPINAAFGSNQGTSADIDCDPGSVLGTWGAFISGGISVPDQSLSVCRIRFAVVFHLSRRDFPPGSLTYVAEDFQDYPCGLFGTSGSLNHQFTDDDVYGGSPFVDPCNGTATIDFSLSW